MNVLPPPWNAEQQQNAFEILEGALKYISASTDWGADRTGRRRLPCPEQPLMLTGRPIGMYHCPGCDDMQIAAMPHLPPDEDYEQVMGHDWPPGYVVES